MRTVHDPDVRAEILKRLDRLSAESVPKWGSMTANDMLFHINAGMRIGLGELTAEPVGNPAFWHTTGKAVALGEAPWPEGAPTSREALAAPPVDFDCERTKFRALLQGIAGRAEEAECPAHPRFGPLTSREWSRFTYNHIVHHFRQFGI